jgi:hypothetical protein
VFLMSSGFIRSATLLSCLSENLNLRIVLGAFPSAVALAIVLSISVWYLTSSWGRRIESFV